MVKSGKTNKSPDLVKSGDRVGNIDPVKSSESKNQQSTSQKNKIFDVDEDNEGVKKIGNIFKNQLNR